MLEGIDIGFKGQGENISLHRKCRGENHAFRPESGLRIHQDYRFLLFDKASILMGFQDAGTWTNISKDA
jgi:hypothetical protein